MAAMVWSEMTVEQQQREIARLDYEDYRAEVADRLKIMEALGLAILRSLTLVNGGAIIALFTFIGNVGQRAVGIDSRAIWFAFAWFVGGLSCAIVSNFCAYFMQSFYYMAVVDQSWQAQAKSLGTEREADHERPFKIGGRWELAAVAASACSLTAFVVGSAVALTGVIRG